MSSQIPGAVVATHVSSLPARSSIRTVVVEANPIIREGLCSFLRNAQVEVVAQARIACEAVEQASHLRPAVLLLSVPALRQEDLAAMQAMRRLYPQIGIVVLSMQGSPEFLLQAISHGATCFLAGDISQEDLVAAVKAASSGRSLVDRDVLLQAAGSILEAERKSAPAADPLASLTAREREVLSLLTDGLSNRIIARELGVSVGTVKTHVCNILSKLHMADRVQAAVWATRRGLGRRSSGARRPT